MAHEERSGMTRASGDERDWTKVPWSDPEKIEAFKAGVRRALTGPLPSKGAMTDAQAKRHIATYEAKQRAEQEAGGRRVARIFVSPRRSAASGSPKRSDSATDS
jgi:hypothetical protein